MSTVQRPATSAPPSGGEMPPHGVLTRDGLELNPAAVATVRRSALSASTMKALNDGCAARFAFSKLQPAVEADPWAATEQGSRAHTVLEDLMHRPGPERTRRAAMNLLSVRADEWVRTLYPRLGIDRTGQALWRADLARKVMGVFETKDLDLAGLETVRTEWPLRGILLRGVPLVGFVDLAHRIAFRGRPRLGVLDWKSGSVPDESKIRRFGDEHGDQVRLYAAGLEAETGEKPARGTLVYTRHGVARNVRITAAETSATLGRFEDGWTLHTTYVESGTFPTLTSPLCGWCPLVNLCPAAQASRFDTDRTESQSALTRSDLVTTEWARGAGPVSRDGGVAPTGRVDAPAGAETTRPTRGDVMSTLATTEKKPWEFDPATADLLDGASATATALFGTASLAAEQLATHDVPLRGPTLTALTRLLADVIRTVQAQLNGQTDWQQGTNTRVRGLLRTVLDTLPLPFGGPADAWQTWRDQAVKRSLGIARSAVDLWDNPHAAPDYTTLASALPRTAADAAATTPWS